MDLIKYAYEILSIIQNDYESIPEDMKDSFIKEGASKVIEILSPLTMEV